MKKMALVLSCLAVALPALAQNKQQAPGYYNRDSSYIVRPQVQGDTLSYESLGSWTFESEARNAMERAAQGFRNSGFNVISSELYCEPYPYYRYRINCQFRYGSRDVAVYGSESGWTFESEAQQAASRAADGFRAAGFNVITAEIYKDAAFPSDNRYRLLYVAGPGMIRSFVGERIAFESDAKKAMQQEVEGAKRAGLRVIIAELFKDSGDYRYRIVYVDFQGNGYMPTQPGGSGQHHGGPGHSPFGR